MPQEDRFKSIFLGLVVLMIGLKYLFVVLMLCARVAAFEFHPLAEIRIVVPTAALLLGSSQVARGRKLRPDAATCLMLTLAVLSLGYGLAVLGEFGLASLRDPVAAITAAPLAMLFSATLWTLQAAAAWLFGGWVVGILFWPRPGLDHADPDE